MDDLRLVKPLPDFVIPSLVSLSLLTGLAGAISFFDGLSAMGASRSQAVVSSQSIEQELDAHASRRQVLNSYQANGLNLIETSLYMSGYWCSSGEKPWNPVTDAMVFEDTQMVFDMAGEIAGRILVNGEFQISQTCWSQDNAKTN